ncbi:putative Pectinesterase inhibitor [Quillaja saponaria]|uniref:Pectinesterase inhibitor n=1 Tax=Quillaja saponaria TaxID=32244 RepID=A0AAD7QAP9_QUISA|nr:putative Pectinesterase inhibitor [Quillaja saponaria]
MNPISGIFLVLLLSQWSDQTHAKRALELSTTSTDLIIQVCSRALQKDMCKNILESDPESKGADIHGLDKIALKTALTNATNINNQINQLLNKESDVSDPKVEQGLSDCSKNYQDAIDQLEDSLAAIDSKGYNDVNTWVTAAIADAESCEQGFKDQKVKSPITPMNTLFSQLCNISLAITNVLVGASDPKQ